MRSVDGLNGAASSRWRFALNRMARPYKALYTHMHTSHKSPVVHCRDTDENISEPQFINLSYVQAQHDYLAGNYPVVREDAAQVGLCFLGAIRTLHT